MENAELKGKKFLENLLKFEPEIGEKKAELAYWHSQEDAGAVDERERIARRRDELQAQIEEMTEKKLKATVLIDKMSDPIGRAVLRRRYILCNTWAQIADGCGGMSERNAHYIHDIALRDFEKIYRDFPDSFT